MKLKYDFLLPNFVAFVSCLIMGSCEESSTIAPEQLLDGGVTITSESSSYDRTDTIYVMTEWNAKHDGSGRLIINADIGSERDTVTALTPIRGKFFIHRPIPNLGRKVEQSIKIVQGISNQQWKLALAITDGNELRLNASVVYDSIEIGGTRYHIQDSIVAASYPWGIRTVYRSEILFLSLH